jgi:hypothetical protein
MTSTSDGGHRDGHFATAGTTSAAVIRDFCSFPCIQQIPEVSECGVVLGTGEKKSVTRD